MIHFGITTVYRITKMSNPLRPAPLLGINLVPFSWFEQLIQLPNKVALCIGIEQLVQYPVKNLPRYSTILSESIETRTIIGFILDPEKFVSNVNPENS